MKCINIVVLSLVIICSFSMFSKGIFEAAKIGDVDCIKKLLVNIPTEKKKEFVSQRDSEGLTPLHWAARYGHAKVVSVLIGAGADPNMQDSYGWTSLGWATFNGQLAVVQILIISGVDLDLRIANDDTALCRAVRYNHPELVRFLISAGADLYKKNLRGETPFDIAERVGDPKIVDLLRVYKGRINRVPHITREHMLTVAQGLHARLGAESPVALACPYILRMIRPHVEQAEQHDARRLKTTSRSLGCVVS